MFGQVNYNNQVIKVIENQNGDNSNQTVTPMTGYSDVRVVTLYTQPINVIPKGSNNTFRYCLKVSNPRLLAGDEMFKRLYVDQNCSTEFSYDKAVGLTGFSPRGIVGWDISSQQKIAGKPNQIMTWALRVEGQDENSQEDILWEYTNFNKDYDATDIFLTVDVLFVKNN